jgi:hypothetical protein
MRKALGVVCATLALLVTVGATPGYAWKTIGYVYCDANQNGQIDPADTPLANVRITVVSSDGLYTNSAISDVAGYYRVGLQDFPASYTMTIDPTSLPAGATVVIPAGGTRAFTDVDYRIDILVDSPTCIQNRCWLTGGGAKFSPITGTMVAEHGPKHSFGGNVNPGCNTDSGEGGQWNHVAHALKLHFQGFVVQVVRCGNVPGIPEGSESPVTPYNFIEFRGTGRLLGISGNKVSYDDVHFWARAEDRNEPGSSGAKDGALVDRYMLHVFLNPADPNGSTLMLIDIDGDPSTVDPVTITDGNLQLHISSCDSPPA